MNTRNENNHQTVVNFVANQFTNIAKYILNHSDKWLFGLLLLTSPVRALVKNQEASNSNENLLQVGQINFSLNINQSLVLDDSLICPIHEKKATSIPSKINDQSDKITIAKKNHAKNIQEAFKKINIIIPLKYILKSFDSLQKLGATNIYLTLKFRSNEYLIRINGQMWPPYKRIYEQNVLPLLKQHDIETTVLFNDDNYQICKKLDDNMRLSSILESKSYAKIYRALQLSGSEIAKYQQILIPNPMVDNPMEKMFDNAIIMLQKKFSQNYSNYFSTFEKSGEYLLKYLSHNKKVLSHNDLLPSSIFVDFTSSKPHIVDWEYSAFSYWSNDLSFLSRELTKQQTMILATHYYSFINKTFSDTSWLQLQANIYLHQFLKLAWKVNPQNILNFESELTTLNEKSDLVETIQAKKTKALSVVSQNSLFNMNQRRSYPIDEVSVNEETSKTSLHI